MFSFFKKKSKLTQDDLNFLQKVVEVLPTKYQYLKPQVTEDFMLNKKPNEIGEKGDYCLVLDANLEKKFTNEDLPRFFILKGVEVWNKKLNEYETVELHIIQGVIFGFKLVAKSQDLDLSDIQIKNISEKHFENKDVNELKEILGDFSNEVKNQIDIEDSFKIEIPEGIFFTIKNIGDGNYLAINKLREVYALIHDPYQISLIHKDLATFVKIMNDKDFDVSEYLVNGGIKM